MKIATYNIWNSESGMPYRIKYIVNEIKLINADVICLQEVSRDRKSTRQNSSHSRRSRMPSSA